MQLIDDLTRMFARPSRSDWGTDRIVLSAGRITDEHSGLTVRGMIMQQMSDALCQAGTNQGVIMHSAGVLLDGQAVCFVGASGSGKTSMAIELARYGVLMGDECAFLDISSATVFYEDFPLQLKTENRVLLSRFEESSTMLAYMPNGRQAAYCVPDGLSDYGGEGVREAPLRFIVFPTYDCRCRSTEIACMDTRSLPQIVLESLVSCDNPSALLRGFLHMCSTHNIMLLRVTYSNGGDAAFALRRYLRGGYFEGCLG